jgi:hypothetical protein
MWQCEPDRKIFTAAGAAAVNPSTIALVWHLFGPDIAQRISLLWDTLGAHGRALFELQGPAMGHYEDLESELQDFWEDQMLPDSGAVPA